MVGQWGKMYLDRVQKQADGQGGLNCRQAASQKSARQAAEHADSCSGCGDVSCNGYFLAHLGAARTVSYLKFEKIHARFLNATVS